MTVLIDPPAWSAHGRLWSHLASDTSFEELHTFAAALGVPERGFEGDHYDVPEEHYDRLVAAGAVPVASRDLLARLVAAGLRRPKRAGERVVVSRPTDGGGRVDVLVSSRVPRGEVAGAVLLLADAGRLAVDERFALPRLEFAVPTRDWPALVTAHLGGPYRQVGHVRWLPAGTAERRLEVVLRADAGAAPAAGLARAEVDHVAERHPLLAPLLRLPGTFA